VRTSGLASSDFHYGYGEGQVPSSTGRSYENPPLALLGSIPSVQVEGEAIGGAVPAGRGSAMTAVPRTAAILASAGRRTEQPRQGTQREHAWQHPPSAIAGNAAHGTSRIAVGWVQSFEPDA
jgi:hypothetical protein